MRPAARSTLLLLTALALLGACGRDATAPRPATPTVRAAVATVAGDYLVAFRGNGVPADFAARVAALGGTVTASHDGAAFATVSGLDAAGAATLAAAGDVADLEPDAPIVLDDPVQTAEADAASVGIASQGDPTTASRYAWQWNMRAIGAPTAWAAGKLGSGSVTVAILDTGIDYDAPDLNGLVDLSRSASFVPSDTSLAKYTPLTGRNVISDYNGHGTNVATQVSSKAAALAGVTSKTTLIGVKVLSGRGSGSLGGVLGGVLWAADHGADVANMSLGGGFAKAGAQGLGGFITRVFNYAARRGLLIVVAAGNDGADLDHDGNFLSTYCNIPQVLCVSATGPELATSNVDDVAYFTNFGRSAISVAGPGGNADAAHNFATSAWPWGTDIASWVWSYCSKTRLVFDSKTGKVLGYTACINGNRLSGFIGTSQATPHVAGLAALLIAETGRGQPAQIRNRIMQSADDLGQPGTDPFYGRGRINVARALGL